MLRLNKMLRFRCVALSTMYLIAAIGLGTIGWGPAPIYETVRDLASTQAWISAFAVMAALLLATGITGSVALWRFTAPASLVVSGSVVIGVAWERFVHNTPLGGFGFATLYWLLLSQIVAAFANPFESGGMGRK